MDEDKIEEIIEKKVEEKIREKEEKTQQNSEDIIEKKIEEKITERNQKNNRENSVEEKNMSRRSFLKTLGLGAGGLAISSFVSGASLTSSTTIGGNTAWHQGNDGKNSGLVASDTDTVDGQHANNFANKKLQASRVASYF